MQNTFNQRLFGAGEYQSDFVYLSESLLCIVEIYVIKLEMRIPEFTVCHHNKSKLVINCGHVISIANRQAIRP